MSNGTRIDPEEREPRAIKIRHPKHTGRKIAVCVLSAILIVALGGGVFAFIEYGPDFLTGFISAEKGTETETKTPVESSQPEVPEEPESVPNVPEEPSEPEEIIPEEPVIEEPVEEPVPEEPEIPKDEWYMLLVNRENPLPADYSFETTVIDQSGHTVDSRIAADLSAMVSASENDGISLVFYTAYRTVQKQSELFSAGKTDVPGGSSEHNCGLALDIGCQVGNFEGSAEEEWLLKNAHEYGFILRYPEGKEDITGFAHEPWHFRYVGREQAKLIFESGLCLEEYLTQE